MIEIESQVKKWGNAFGIIIPKEIINKEKIKEGFKVNLTIQPKNKITVGDLMKFSEKNKLPKLKKRTALIMKEIDRELWPE